jgi:hypothetical protein
VILNHSDALIATGRREARSVFRRALAASGPGRAPLADAQR